MRPETSPQLTAAALALALAFSLSLALAGPMATAARAQSAPSAPAAPPMMGARGMPDLRVMNGKPLPSPDLAPGTVMVRVARKMPVNAVVGIEVSAIIKNPGGDLKKRTAKTDGNGRAIFEGVGAGQEFQATVTVDGETLTSTAFPMPAQGGVKTMLIAGIGSAPAGGDDRGAGAGDAAGGPNDDFSIGASTGTAAPAPNLPTKTLEVQVYDESGRPAPNQKVLLGAVGQSQGPEGAADGKLKIIPATTDAQGLAKFEGLATGSAVGYAAVVDYRGMRIGTQPFTMPDSGGARAEIRALARTSDQSAITIGAGGRIIVQMHEEVLQVLEILPIENRSDKLFDPGVGGIEIPLPKGFVSAQTAEGSRKLEIRQNHGVAVHGPVMPKASLGAEADNAKAAGNEVTFEFSLPYGGSSHTFEQRMPNGIGPTTLICEQAGDMSIEGPGIGARESRELNGRKYWVMLIEAVPPGQTLSFVVKGLPTTDSSGRVVAGVLALLLIVGSIVFGRRPAQARKATIGERDKLLARREALFSDLVAAERERRKQAAADGAAAGAGAAPAKEKRGQLVTRLETVYRELAALDEQRAL
jgi:hypothetical protein